jgi:hypothetical protein
MPTCEPTHPPSCPQRTALPSAPTTTCPLWRAPRSMERGRLISQLISMEGNAPALHPHSSHSTRHSKRYARRETEGRRGRGGGWRRYDGMAWRRRRTGGRREMAARWRRDRDGREMQMHGRRLAHFCWHARDLITHNFLDRDGMGWDKKGWDGRRAGWDWGAGWNQGWDQGSKQEVRAGRQEGEEAWRGEEGERTTTTASSSPVSSLSCTYGSPALYNLKAR